MKQGMKNIFPTFLSLVIILVFEIINNVDAIRYTMKFDLQLIGNVLLVIIGAYSVLCISIELKQSCKLLEVHWLNNFFIVVSAFVLNVIVFEDKISKFKNLFTEWHTVWSLWFCILSIWFTNIGKCIPVIWRNMQSGKTNKVFLRTIIIVGILFVAVQVLPHILPVIGNLISFAIIIFGLILTVIYFGREKIQQNFKVKWEDLTIVLGIFYLVTFILLPGIGTTTMEVGNVEDVKTYLELITAGIEFFKEFL